MAGNFVRSALISGAEELIRQLGGKPATICRRAGVSLEALRDPDIPLQGRAGYDFLEIAAHDTRCRTFGLRLGSQAPLASVIGPLYVLLRNAQTIGQMFEDLAANFDIYTGIATMTSEHVEGGVLLTWSSTAGFAESEVQMAEYALAVLCTEIRRQTGSNWQSPSVEFRHAAPANLADHHRQYGRNLGFDRDRNAVFLEKAVATRAPGTAAPRSRRLVTALLRRDEDVIDPSMGVRVESIVRSLLPFAPCTVTDVARALGIPVRTLQHHLNLGGQSFTDIKDQVRADLAIKYLRHSRLGLAEISGILGYSEPSAFSRSFRRWHGTTPRGVRSEALAGG